MEAVEIEAILDLLIKYKVFSKEEYEKVLEWKKQKR